MPPTVIRGEYGDTILGNNYQPRERDFVAERLADRIELPALLRERGWTEADLDEARAFLGFPQGARELRNGFGWRTPEAIIVFSRRAIAEWDERFVRFAETLEKK